MRLLFPFLAHTPCFPIYHALCLLSRCCHVSMPHSARILLELPPPQLADAIKQQPEIAHGLRELATTTALPPHVIALVGEPAPAATTGGQTEGGQEPMAVDEATPKE